MKKICVFFVLLFLAGDSFPVHGQEKKSKKQRKIEQMEKVRKLMENQDYVFVAERAYPVMGRSIFLTSPYDLTVSRDTVSAFLPYFGRIYTMPADPAEGGIKFVSKKFDYIPQATKKNGWNIKIITNDGNRRYELFLSVSENGTANLSVSDITRQSIRFNGYIEQRNRQP
ncbi:MAG: DUF4251 domain-containing protein [Bacteroidales bacterium]|jgi:hypothetical protein|nr:DUF4251 domain-containing protein [Bacteroidales bacterium]